MEGDQRKEEALPEGRKGNDMGQNSLERSLEATKGPSRSRQGPKKVPIRKDKG